MTARLALLSALVAALAGCGAGQVAPTDSGVRGRILIGPMCPVEQVGVPCPDKPFQADIQVRREGSGKTAASVRSGKDGRFRLNLAPGRYVLVPISPNPGAPPQAGPVRARVRAHAFTRVTIAYDSGIR